MKTLIYGLALGQIICIIICFLVTHYFGPQSFALMILIGSVCGAIGMLLSIRMSNVKQRNFYVHKEYVKRFITPTYDEILNQRNRRLKEKLEDNKNAA